MHYAVHGHTAAELIYERADDERSSFFPFFSTTLRTSAPKFRFTICLFTDKVLFFKINIIPCQGECFTDSQTGVKSNHKRYIIPSITKSVNNTLPFIQGQNDSFPWFALYFWEFDRLHRILTDVVLKSYTALSYPCLLLLRLWSIPMLRRLQWYGAISGSLFLICSFWWVQ